MSAAACPICGEEPKGAEVLTMCLTDKGPGGTLEGGSYRFTHRFAAGGSKIKCMGKGWVRDSKGTRFFKIAKDKSIMEVPFSAVKQFP